MSETPKLHVYRVSGYIECRYHLHDERMQARGESEIYADAAALARMFCPDRARDWDEFAAHVTARREDE